MIVILTVVAAMALLTTLIVVIGIIGLLRRSHKRHRVAINGHVCKRTNAMARPNIYECVDCGETHKEYWKDEFSDACDPSSNQT